MKKTLILGCTAVFLTGSAAICLAMDFENDSEFPPM